MRSALERLAEIAVTVIGVITLIFIILRAAPGDPATAMLGPDASAEDLAKLRESLGLNDPLVVQYVDYLRTALTLDFGTSTRHARPALEVVLERFPATIQLTLAVTLVAVLVGIALGMTAGMREGGWLDTGMSSIAITLQSIPTFWVGVMLILLFSLQLRVLPSAGAGTLAHLILPTITLSLPFIGIVARMTRASVTETMRLPHIDTARSKGLTEARVLSRHVLRNSLIPVVTVVAIQTGTLLGGAVIVENVFAWPGLGTLIVTSIANRDYPVVQTATVFLAIIVILLNQLADFTYRLIDPRIGKGVRA